MPTKDASSVNMDFYTNTHRLTFNSIFSDVKNINGTVSFKVIYPEMFPFSKELSSRFYTPQGTIGKDRIDIRLTEHKVISDLQNSVEASINDRGRFNKERKFLFDKNLIKAELAEKDPLGVSKYKSITEQGTNFFYFFEGKDKRVTSVSCNIKPLCNGTTTWQGKISISYRFNIEHLINIKDLDRKIYDLVASLNPKQMEIEL